MSLALPRKVGRRIGLIALALFFIISGANHFFNQPFYLRMMPGYLPAHKLLVQLSGLLEMAGGIGVLVPETQSLAGYGLVALLVAVFPANVEMAIHPDRFVASGFPLWGLYARLPLQIPIILWAYWATRPEGSRTAQHSPGPVEIE